MPLFIRLLLILLMLTGCTDQGFRSASWPSQSPIGLPFQSNALVANKGLANIQSALNKGDTTLAAFLLNQIDSSQLSASDKNQWQLFNAQLALARYDSQSALAALSQLDLNVLSANQRDQTILLKAQAFSQEHKPLVAANLLMRAQRDSAQPLQFNEAIWHTLNQLSNTELNALGNPDNLSDGWITLMQLQRQSSGNLGNFSQQYLQWRAVYPQHPAALQEPLELQAMGEMPEQSIRRIAVALPQSGSFASAANTLRQGIQAARQSLINSGQTVPSLVFIDSSNTSVQDLYQQAKTAGAQLMIGPLEKDQVSQLETQRNLPLPTLALNYGNHLSNISTNLYEFGLSAEDEARQVAEFAARRGFRSASALVPSNDWGQRVYNTFAQTWSELGNTLLNRVNYDSQGNVAGSVSALFRQGNPDMLFMLALPAYARQVPPNLRYQGRGNLPILATSQVYGDQVMPAQDTDLNGVIFPVMPWSIATFDSSYPIPFKDAYRQLQAQPELSASALRLNAMGVDAFQLALRLGLYQRMPTTKTQGATGTITVDSQRRFLRQPTWAIFKNGKPQLL